MPKVPRISFDYFFYHKDDEKASANPILVMLDESTGEKTPEAWKEKRQWVEEHFNQVFYKRIIMTHHKNLIEADILIDDRKGTSTLNFKGNWIWFGQNGMNWKEIVIYIQNLV